MHLKNAGSLWSARARVGRPVQLTTRHLPWRPGSGWLSPGQAAATTTLPPARPARAGGA